MCYYMLILYTSINVLFYSITICCFLLLLVVSYASVTSLIRLFLLSQGSIGNLSTSEVGIKFAYILPSFDSTLWDYIKLYYCCC
uniref:Putative ovule protein n=1 Tax=Solanum chacoense TaxID=4108 RepID=A0A0V0HQ52_SOLCH